MKTIITQAQKKINSKHSTHIAPCLLRQRISKTDPAMTIRQIKGRKAG
ncbi:MAG: hypothetical protein IJH80_00075 [Ruminococcus sp.]|nr:hypothetical protein [Ruminococcus sp.]MBQ7070976.1 hypothetical protein [Ruminococcus sp.]